MKYESFTLSNGIRLIHKFTPSVVAHCGLIINAGSRDEGKHEHGMAHFIDHVFFKGTKKRKAYHILSRLEDVGGQINAYTAKEETCIYSSFINNYYNRSIELISDIIFNSTFPNKELNIEKEVILDEINSYKDIPGELIYDNFEELIFQNETIGRNILGNPENIKHFTKKDIELFIKNNYFTDEMVFCSVGKIKFSKLKKLFEKYFGAIPSSFRKNKRIKFENYRPDQKIFHKNTFQAHCIIGNIAYDIKDNRRIGLALLNNILGGPGLNSRLNLSLREKKGYVYNVESTYSPYSDTGVLSIYFGTEKGNLEKSIHLVHKEFIRLKISKLGSLQLKKFKRQLTGQLAISAESNENLMLAMAKSYLIFNRIDSLKKVSKKIEALTAEQIMDIANEVLNSDKLSTLIYK